MVEQLSIRMRGEAPYQQIMLSFNPISRNHWLYDFCENKPPESFIYTHSTYRDNPFLSAEYIAALEELRVRNPAKARIFCDGLWGVDSEGLVLRNWTQREFVPEELAAAGCERRAGLDLGWIDKTAVIDTLYDRGKKTIYVFNELYKSGLQLSDISAGIKRMNLKKCKIFCDSAEPRSIQFFRQEGINAVPCAKGKDSIKAGLMFLQDHYIVVHPSCKNFIMELENFSYIKSKQTGEWTEDTTHEFSHAIDACRYAYSDIYTNTRLQSMSKSALGL